MSGSSRDSLFPATSIGRSHGQQIQRSVSPSPSLREPLATHPLLSPSPTSNLSPATASPLDPTGNQYPTTTRYVPYIPKQRVSSIATTGTTNHSPLSISTQPHHGDATSKLQVMNLKAAAQNIGLDTASVGWAMLEKLIHENDHSPEWNELWYALSIDKATLLLPLEPNTEVITADFIKSHVVFCDDILPVTGSTSPIVTLSGLRATLSGDQLVFRSSVHSSSKVYEKILNSASRASGLASLPPLSTTSRPYPTLTLSHTGSGPSHLPLPPRPPQVHKPPLPPRPGTLAKPPGQPSAPMQSRLGNPFASFFGSKSTTSAPASSSAAPTDSPATSVSTLPDEANDHPIGIPVYAIDKRIQFPAVAKAVCKELREEVKNSLNGDKNSGLSSWLVNMVVEWLEKSFFPFIKNKSSRTSGEAYVVNEFAFETEEISRTVQGFYSEIAEAVVKRLRRRSKLKRRINPQSPGFSTDRASLISATEEEISESEKEKIRTSPIVAEETEEEKVRQVMESVEGTICDLFYDRLFVPSNSDDLSHDEALSSRIAALNLLDLSLENLGIEIYPSAVDDVMDVIRLCGDALTQLDSPDSRRPVVKSALLVKAHKIIVEELSKLPPVRLSGEAEGSGLPRGSKSPAPSPLTLHIKELEPLPPGEPHTSTIDGAADGHSTLTSLASHQDPTSPSGCLYPPDEPKPFKPTPVSGDVILPLMIYSVVKSNPPRLLSHLLYTQRFRNESFGGEESYCLINLLAAAEFLENVDLDALGLQAEGIKTSDLTPLPVARSRSASLGSVDVVPPTPTTTESGAGAATRLRGRVEQQVDAITGSANKVLSGVVDSSFGVLRALLPGGQNEQNVPQPPEAAVQESKPGFGLLKRETGFSIATLAAALPIARQRSNQSTISQTTAEESGQQMMEVSRPSSRTSRHSRTGGTVEDTHESSEESEVDSVEGAEEEDDEEHDTRSIKSFESMMSQRKRRRRRKGAAGRKSLADRLANVPGLQKLSHTLEPRQGFDAKPVSPGAERSSLASAVQKSENETPSSSRPSSPVPVRIAPPVQRFLECAEDDLRLSEVRALLNEYRRVVEGMRALGGFRES